jgi:Tfp pilus assembly PilM family ATPase
MRAAMPMIPDLSRNCLWGVLDVGFRSSRLYLGVGETPIYVRSLRSSGDLMTRRIASELNLDPAMAERYKRHYGVRAETGSYRPLLALDGPVDDKRMSSILLGTLTPIFRGMAHDIERSFRYAMDLYPALPVSGLMLAGGGSSLDGLPELLTEMLGISVFPASADRLAITHQNHPALEAKRFAGMLACLGLGYGDTKA